MKSKTISISVLSILVILISFSSCKLIEPTTFEQTTHITLVSPSVNTTIEESPIRDILSINDALISQKTDLISDLQCNYRFVKRNNVIYYLYNNRIYNNHGDSIYNINNDDIAWFLIDEEYNLWFGKRRISHSDKSHYLVDLYEYNTKDNEVFLIKSATSDENYFESINVCNNCIILYDERSKSLMSYDLSNSSYIEIDNVERDNYYIINEDEMVYKSNKDLCFYITNFNEKDQSIRRIDKLGSSFFSNYTIDFKSSPYSLYRLQNGEFNKICDFSFDNLWFEDSPFIISGNKIYIVIDPSMPTINVLSIGGNDSVIINEEYQINYFSLYNEQLWFFKYEPPTVYRLANDKLISQEIPLSDVGGFEPFSDVIIIYDKEGNIKYFFYPESRDLREIIHN